VRALILGGAATVWSDADRALALGEFDLTIAVNDIGKVWKGRVDHWVSLHPDKLKTWIGERRKAGLNADFQTWAHRRYRGVGKRESLPHITSSVADWHGSSGLLAVAVALRLKCTRIVLAGVPMSPKAAHFFDEKPWVVATRFQMAWKRNLPEIKDFVRSMSGWTAELLGEPTAAWIEEGKDGSPTDASG
jgi:hypothetical protein